MHELVHGFLLPSHVSGLGQWQGWAGWIQPGPYGLNYTQHQKKKNKKFRPQSPLNYFFLFWYLVKQVSFYIRKFLKNLWTLFNLFIGFFYFFKVFYYIFDLWIFTVKCKSVMRYIFFPFKKIKNICIDLNLFY